MSASQDTQSDPEDPRSLLLDLFPDVRGMINRTLVPGITAEAMASALASDPICWNTAMREFEQTI